MDALLVRPAYLPTFMDHQPVRLAGGRGVLQTNPDQNSPQFLDNQSETIKLRVSHSDRLSQRCQTRRQTVALVI
jgi:hypothetical protein